MELDVVDGAYGNDAEEHQHEYVAQAHIGEMCGVEETKHHAEYADEYHLQSAKIHQRQAHEARQACGEGNGMAHLVDAHPPLCTGTARTKPMFGVVGSLGKVEEVVDEIGVYLHYHGKQDAKQCCCPAESLFLVESNIVVGKRESYHHRHSGTGQCFRTCGEKPSLG